MELIFSLQLVSETYFLEIVIKAISFR